MNMKLNIKEISKVPLSKKDLFKKFRHIKNKMNIIKKITKIVCGTKYKK